jgi:hypothetical protein
MERRK